MATTFGVTDQGFVTKQQASIISEIQVALQNALGVNINLLPEAVFGQIVGVFSEREALIWQVVEGAYDSQYPSGAEGTSVDNILALNNLRRLGASATKTSPTEDGIPGLVLFGDPATLVPKGSIITVFGTPSVQFTTDASVTIGSPVDAVQTIIFSNIPTVGSFQLSIVDPSSNTLTSEAIPWDTNNTTQLSINSTPATGSFEIQLSQAGSVLTTPPISTASGYPAATDIQTAIRTLSGYSFAGVGGSAGSYFIIWGTIANPLATIVANTSGVSITKIDSLQAAINNLFDSANSNYPYTDAVVTTGAFSVGFTITFGSGTVIGSNPSCGDQPQSLFVPVNNSLQASATVTNISVNTTVIGLLAQAIAAATCTVDGPNFVPANTLTVIGSPVSGWTGVTNPLDCITGMNIEDDTEALTRREASLQENANGPLPAIIEKVSAVNGVTSVIGNQNLSLAAQQIISFGAVPVIGSFTISINGLTTAPIAFNATAGDVQSAINALSGYSPVTVVGSFLAGFTISFNGSNGGQPQPLALILSNTLGIPATVAFGLPGKSIQIIVAGTASFAGIADAIFSSAPAGIETYGTPFNTTGNTNASSNPNLLTSVANVAGIVAGQVISGAGIPLGTTVLSVAGSTVTMSNNATATASGVAVSFTYSFTVQDQFGNKYVINWQTPVVAPVFVSISLTTDLMINGQPNPNAKFSTGSIPTIQQDVVSIGNSVPIGGTIIGFGSNGLVGCFNSVPGIISYTISFGLSSSPTMNSNISLPPAWQALFETFNTIISYV